MKRSKSRSPAVFLDRDGTLIHDVGYLKHPSQIKLYSGADRALKALRRAGFKLIVISNQSGVARGYFPEAAVHAANRKLQSLLKKKGAWLDDFFYCPHYPQGKVKSFSKECDCRKPKTKLVQEAVKRHRIDLSKSYMVGDKKDDLLLARNAEMAGGFLVRTGNGSKTEKEMSATEKKRWPQSKDLLSVSGLILKQKVKV